MDLEFHPTLKQGVAVSTVTYFYVACTYESYQTRLKGHLDSCKRSKGAIPICTKLLGGLPKFAQKIQGLYMQKVQGGASKFAQKD